MVDGDDYVYDDDYDDEYDVNSLWKWIIAGALFFDVSIVGLASLSVVLLLSQLDLASVRYHALGAYAKSVYLVLQKFCLCKKNDKHEACLKSASKKELFYKTGCKSVVMF